MRGTTVAVLALLGAFAVRATEACCAAFPRGEVVTISKQEILVAWNPGTKVEHFVRRATFGSRGAARNFGFLVPTPSKPTLGEAPDGAFDRLDAAIKPEERNETDRDYYFSIFSAPMDRDYLTKGIEPQTARSLGESVRVLEQVRVAGYDVSILEADDATSLTKWLAEHGYDARPEITDWVTPYVAAHWKVSAFKFATPAGERASVGTGAVRMTFTTDRPLFPYRVPKDQRGGSDTLRVYYAGTERVDGTLGAAPSPWTKETKFSNHVAALPSILESVAPKDQPAGGDWLTAFEDHNWPGGAEDLYFAPTADKSPLVPPPIIHRHLAQTYVPLDLAGVLIAGVLVVRAVVRRIKRTR